MKSRYVALLLWVGGLLHGCAGATGNVASDNPIERGLSYIAAAIVTHAIIGAFFRE